MKKIYSFLLLAAIGLFGAQNVMANYYVTHNANLPTGGDAWTLQQSQDLMTEDNGVYYLIVNNVGTEEVQFKITTDGSWDGANGDNLDTELSDNIPGLAGNYDGNNKNIGFHLTEAADIIIYFNPSEPKKVYVKYYVTASPIVHLSANAANVLAGETITLTANAEHFSGAVSYAYSYSTDGGTNYTAMAGNTMVAGAAGTAYKFKVVATYNAEEAEATTDVHVVVCTVAGNLGDFFGTTWDAANADNDMSYYEGVFTWVKNVYLSSAATLSFKVAQNHDWAVSYPNNDYNQPLAVGYNTVTITLNWSNKEVSCEVVNRPKVMVALACNDWNVTEMLYNPSGYLYENFNLVPGSQEFKLKVNETWLGYKYGNDSTLTRTSCENKGISSDNNSVVLADVEGAYTFFYKDGLLSVDFPNSFTRTADVNLNYQTLCVPFDATISNATVYEVTNATTGGVTLGTPNLAYMEAGHSYIIKPTATSMTISKVNEGTSVAEAINPIAEASALYGTLGDTLHYNHATDENPNWTFYVLYDNKFYLLSGTATSSVASTKAHLHVILPAQQQDAPEAIRIIMEGEEATNIENLGADENAVKFIQNGKLFIKKNGVVYDAVGSVVR